MFIFFFSNFQGELHRIEYPRILGVVIVQSVDRTNDYEWLHIFT